MTREQDESSPSGLFNRRNLLAVGGAGAAGAGLMSGAVEARPALDVETRARGRIEIALTVNGQARRLALDPRTSLLDALRDHLGLTGSKKGCDHGQCGACTVLVDGRRVLGCLTLAAAVRGPVTTIEGIAPAGGDLHPMQQAFIDQDAFQCGYCTPGQILSAIACIHEGHAGSDDEIREYMSGNLCRCAAYPHILAAIKQAAGQMKA